MKSVMSHSFSVAPSISAPRSSFDRSFGHKTTMDAGYLVPFYVDDVLPGDTFNLNSTIFARLNTPAFPVMDNMYLDTHFFFVPTRLVWENSKKFFGEQKNPGDSTDYTIPVLNSYAAVEGSLSDYFGLPIGKTMTNVSSLYFRAYNLIWNEWFRDQNLQNSATVNVNDGPESPNPYFLRRRGKRHDYFTSALPWPQKGDAVNIPLTGNAPIFVNNNLNNTTVGIMTSTGATAELRTTVTSPPETTPVVHSSASVDPSALLYANLSDVTSATINDLREAFQVQKLLERDARGGTRYSELVRNHFGVNFYDVSYRPEFLGGGSTPVNITPVAATAETGTTTFPGQLGAMGTALANGHGFSKSFVEHGIVMGFMSVRADLTYQQGMPKHFMKRTRHDIFWPSLAHLGEQAIFNGEIFYQGTSADSDVFGYQERYAEYRYKPSMITGRFRSDSAQSLDPWHLSQDFASLPVLGDAFIQENPPIDRVVRFPDEPHFIVDSYTSLRCARPMPVFGVPGLIDHF